MSRSFYYPKESSSLLELPFSAASEWSQFREEFVSFTPVQRNTIVLGAGTAAGTVSGDAGERRVYTLKGFRAHNMEVKGRFSPSLIGNGQLGFGLRKQNQIMAVGWINIVFGLTGQWLSGVWDWVNPFGPGQVLDTNPGPSSLGFPTTNINTSGDGATVTTELDLPFYGEVGQLVDMSGINAAFTNAETITGRPTASSFQIADVAVGPFAGGVARYFTCPDDSNFAARLVENQLQIKQWLPSEAEASYSDPLRAVTYNIPTTLSSGRRFPSGYGEFGLIVAHLGAVATVGLSDITVTSLD